MSFVEQLTTSLTKEFAALLLGTIGGSIALWRWYIDQRWRRVQFAYDLVKAFFAKETTKLVKFMLDVDGKLNVLENQPDRMTYIDDDILILALATFDQHDTFDEEPLEIRLIFDEFFDDLSMFQHHIDAGLIELEDVKPYLDYWLKALTGSGQVRGTGVGAQAGKFLSAFDYKAVIRLVEASGYRFPTEPTMTQAEAGQHSKEGHRQVAIASKRPPKRRAKRPH